jgi:L-fucose mutarotase/ribose pyranase (RbsD/FucU family)
MCIVFILQQTATFALYNINLFDFLTEMKSVYCAVRTGSLNETVYA